MFNKLFRNAVRNRSRQYRKFGRSAWVKRSAMSRPRKPKASRFVVNRDSSYLRAQIGKRPIYEPPLPEYDYRLRKRRKFLFENQMEDWLRQHPDSVKFATGVADMAWDNGGRYIVRGHLKKRLRGIRKGREDL